MLVLLLLQLISSNHAYSGAFDHDGDSTVCSEGKPGFGVPSNDDPTWFLYFSPPLLQTGEGKYGSYFPDQTYNITLQSSTGFIAFYLTPMNNRSLAIEPIENCQASTLNCKDKEKGVTLPGILGKLEASAQMRWTAPSYGIGDATFRLSIVGARRSAFSTEALTTVYFIENLVITEFDQRCNVYSQKIWYGLGTGSPASTTAFPNGAMGISKTWDDGYSSLPTAINTVTMQLVGDTEVRLDKIVDIQSFKLDGGRFVIEDNARLEIKNALPPLDCVKGANLIPTNLTAFNITYHSAVVSWSHPSLLALALMRSETSYSVSLRSSSTSSTDARMFSTIADETALLLTNLTAFTKYSIRVMTDTKISRGPSSASIEFSTFATPIIKICNERITWSGKMSGKTRSMKWNDGFQQNPETNQMVLLNLIGHNKTVTLSENVTTGSINLFAGPTVQNNGNNNRLVIPENKSLSKCVCFLFLLLFAIIRR